MIAGLPVCHLPTKSSPSRPTTVLSHLIMSRIMSREGKKGGPMHAPALTSHQHKIHINFLNIAPLLLTCYTGSESCVCLPGHIRAMSLAQPTDYLTHQLYPLTVLMILIIWLKICGQCPFQYPLAVEGFHACSTAPLGQTSEFCVCWPLPFFFLLSETNEKKKIETIWLLQETQ